LTRLNGRERGAEARGPGLDFMPPTTVVTFNPRESTKTVNVPVFGDLITEMTETVNLTLTGLGTVPDIDVQNAVLNINDTATAFRSTGAICTNLGGPADVYPSTINVASGPVQIGRYDRARRVTLSGNLDGVSLGEATSAIEKLPLMANLPAGVTYVSEGEAEVMKDVFTAVILSLGAGVICST